MGKESGVNQEETMATPIVEISRNSNVANYINEAAQWNEITRAAIEELVSVIYNMPPDLAKAVIKAHASSIHAEEWLRMTGVVTENHPLSVITQKFTNK